MKSRAFLWCSGAVLTLFAALATERAFGDEPTPQRPPIIVKEMSDGTVLVHDPPEITTPPKPRIPKRRSLALEAFGVVNVVVGGSGLFFGFITAATLGTRKGCASPTLSADGTGECAAWTTDHSALNIGIGLMLGGGALIGAGVPMILFGKKQARISPAVPEVGIGAGGASFSWKL